MCVLTKEMYQQRLEALCIAKNPKTVYLHAMYRYIVLLHIFFYLEDGMIKIERKLHVSIL